MVINMEMPETPVLRDAKGQFALGSPPANPAGRPVKAATNLRRALVQCLEFPSRDARVIEQLGEHATLAHDVMHAACEHATKGSMDALRMLMDRVDGPMPTQVNMHHTGNNPIAGLAGQALLDATLVLLTGGTPASVAEIVDAQVIECESDAHAHAIEDSARGAHARAHASEGEGGNECGEGRGFGVGVVGGPELGEKSTPNQAHEQNTKRKGGPRVRKRKGGPPPWEESEIQT